MQTVFEKFVELGDALKEFEAQTVGRADDYARGVKEAILAINAAPLGDLTKPAQDAVEADREDLIRRLEDLIADNTPIEDHPLVKMLRDMGFNVHILG